MGLKILGVFLWSLLILMVLPILYIKSLELRLLFAGYRMGKILIKMTDHKFIKFSFVEDIINNEEDILFIDSRKTREYIMKEVKPRYALHHFCIVDNTDINNQIVYIFKNFFEYRKYFKLFMREIH